jgi:hypothetical protein
MLRASPVSGRTAVMDVEFRNVTITVVDAKDAVDAYEKLMFALSSAGFNWTPDIFIEHRRATDDEAQEKDTAELFRFR